MGRHVLKKGFDIPIKGGASGEAVALPMPDTVSIDPREFKGVVPRLAKRAGDTVLRGETLFYDKRRPELCFVSAVSGTVKEVRRGHRRVITGIIVEVDKDSTDFVSHEGLDGEAATADAVRARLQAGGLWYTLRQRPLDHVPGPNDTPQSILIRGTETGPLQPGADVMLSVEDKECLQAGIDALGKLTPGSVFLTVSEGQTIGAFQGLTGVEVHSFKGPHPSGDATVQVNHIDPPRGENTVWYVTAWDVVRIGKLVRDGEYVGTRVYASVGAGVTPRFVKTVVGAPLAHIVGGELRDDIRWIRGSVLTGDAVEADTYGGWFTSAIHALPQEVPRRLFGWMMPAFGQMSAHRAFLSGWIGGKNHDLRPGLNGGHRGLVPVGQYRRVTVTPDIEPEFLMKALAANDLEESISLGMLEFSMEEAALCTYIDPSKIEFDVLLQQGLERYEKET